MKKKKPTFRDARRELPDGVNDDPQSQHSVEDLLFAVQTELDICNEEPDQYERMTKKEFGDHKTRLRKYLRKYGK